MSQPARGWLLCLAALSGAAWAQDRPPARFAAQAIEQGREQFHRTCAQCHGRNMVNAGTTTYDLRKFPGDQEERFALSVNNGKGNMPSFKDALSNAQIQLLWAYVASRGGREP